MIGTLGVAVSPLVLGMGLFLMIRPHVNPLNMALIVTLCVNAVLSLPFVLRVLRPNVEQTLQSYSKLSQSWPRIMGQISLGDMATFASPMGFSAGLVPPYYGDLGVITLFGDAERATLPFMIHQLMGSYRMEQAASGAVLL